MQILQPLRCAAFCPPLREGNAARCEGLGVLRGWVRHQTYHQPTARRASQAHDSRGAGARAGARRGRDGCWDALLGWLSPSAPPLRCVSFPLSLGTRRGARGRAFRGARRGPGAVPRGVGASRRRGPRVKRFWVEALAARSALAGRWRTGRPAPRGGQGRARGPTSQPRGAGRGPWRRRGAQGERLACPEPPGGALRPGGGSLAREVGTLGFRSLKPLRRGGARGLGRGQGPPPLGQGLGRYLTALFSSMSSVSQLSYL